MRPWAEAGFLILVAAVLVILGRWGSAHAELLVPAHFEGPDRERKRASVRRGALACYVGAGALVAAAVLTAR